MIRQCCTCHNLLLLVIMNGVQTVESGLRRGFPA
jgi:hypothetical protein